MRRSIAALVLVTACSGTTAYTGAAKAPIVGTRAVKQSHKHKGQPEVSALRVTR